MSIEYFLNEFKGAFNGVSFDSACGNVFFMLSIKTLDYYIKINLSMQYLQFLSYFFYILLLYY